jgi:hypothetical protein
VQVGVASALKASGGAASDTFDPADMTVEQIKAGVLLGLAEELGEELSHVHGAALRRSVQIQPDPNILNSPMYQEAHARGEVLVAASLYAFVEVYRDRLRTLGRDLDGKLPVTRVIEEGTLVADHMLSVAIRGIDYAPPVDVTFGDFLSAMVTADREVHPDDSFYNVRKHLIESFAKFGIEPASSSEGEAGLWRRPPDDLNYSLTHFDAMQRDPDEVFRFVWENRFKLGLCEEAFTRVASVRPSMRVARDGFVLRETVAEYIQILDLKARDLVTLQLPADGKQKPRSAGIRAPKGLEEWRHIRMYGGGVLIFDEYGRLKHHIHNSVLNKKNQNRRLQYLFDAGLLTKPRTGPNRSFAVTHTAGRQLALPARKEPKAWQ